MTMVWKTGLAALAVLALGMATASAQENDLGAKIYRLGDVSGFATERTDGTDSETVLVGRGGGHGGGHGGHGGGHFHGGGFHSASFHHGSFHSFKSFHSVHFHNRSFVSVGFGFGFPYYSYYRPFYCSYPTYYYYPS